MKLSLQKVLSFVLVLVMVLGIVPFAAFADEVQQASASVTSMEGLSISYPYNTETVKQTGSVTSRFSALTFESARNEAESAQMILSPDFDVSSFQLTMGSLKNASGNIIPGWAFEVYVQHYVTVTGSGNAANYSSTHNMYHPKEGKTGLDGTYPDGLIPQDAAIAAGENKISAGKNGGLWVNLNVESAAPGTYTGFATLTVNGTDMQIPVSVRIYDVTLPDEVHTNTPMGIQWDQLQTAEGIDLNTSAGYAAYKELSESYFEYLVSKRVMPMVAWNVTRYDDAFAEYAASYLAVAPEISSYSLHYERNAEGTLNTEVLENTLTTLINKNLELAQSGSDVDLFKKAYFYVIDEPANDAAYAKANTVTAQLESVKNELAPMLSAYPQLQESFMGIKHVVTSCNPTDKTYSKVGNLFNYFINENLGNTPLTGNSYIYCPQFQWLHTENQRNLYANESELWWYGCCHPIAPYPTYQLNTPLVAARAIGWMMYDYGIDGNLYWSVNSWNQYNYQYDNYSNHGTPGDGVLLLPGSAYGVDGPIGTIRIENIRESNEDYEYLWMLENEYGISNISPYTANMYSGVIPNTDASIHYNNRIALLSELERLSVAKNGATQIAPGQEGFVRGQTINANTNNTYSIANTEEVAAISFEYKIISGNSFEMAILPNSWSSYYGYYTFTANGIEDEGITCISMDDGYTRVYMVLDELDSTYNTPGKVVTDLFKRGGDAAGYIDNIQLYTEIPEIEEPTEPPTEAPTESEEPVEVTYEISAGLEIDVENGTYDYISFEYQITNDAELSIAFLNPGWGKYYGYYTFNTAGKVWNDAGIYCETLEDGFVRVVLKVSELERTNNAYNLNNAPEVIDLALVSYSCAATGTIRNVVVANACGHIYENVVTPPDIGVQGFTTHTCIICGHSYVDSYVDPIQPEEPAEPTYEISAGLQIDVENGTYDYISFEYQITNDAELSIAFLNPGWGKYYGYYTFNTAGKVWNDAGIYCETLDDGFIRVVLKTSELERTNNAYNLDNAPEIIDFALVSYSCAATGTIRNVNVYNEAVCDHSYNEIVTAPSFTANGYTTYTCSACGHSYVGDETLAYTFSVPQWNIALADDIRANFHVNVDSRLTDAQITVLVDGNGYRYNLSELATTADGYYIVSANVAAAQMTDDITIQVAYGDIVSEVKSYSIRGYAEYILTNSDDENTKLLVQRMLNYGAAAQTYFVYNTGNMANAGYEMTDVPVIPEAEDGSVASGNVVGIDYYGASLLYETRVGVRFYFTVTGRIEDYTFTDAAGNTYEPVSKSGMYYVEVMNINPNAYDDAIEMSVTDGTNTLTVGYSPMRYISRKYYGSTDAKLVNLVAQMYQYHKAAELFLNENDDEPEAPKEVFDGGSFTSGNTLTIDLDNAQAVTHMTFDYQITDGESFSIALLPGSWSNYYGYFVFNNSGAAYKYAGIFTEQLDNGYIRVYVDFAKLTQFTGTPDSTVINTLFMRNVTANGTITNICINSAAEVAPRGQAIVAGQSLSVMTEAGNYSQVILDMIVPAEGGENEIGIALLDTNWNYYGYFYLEKTGLENPYAGVSAEQLSDGYWRITINIDEIDGSRTHGDVGMIERVYINNHTTGGYIDNVQFVVREEPEYVDYAVSANGVKRAGSPTWEDTAEGLQVTFAAAGNRFEIKCGDQTAAANGTLRFKIKTDLTSIKLGGCNYSGGRKTTVTVDLTASADGYTVTDLGDGWVLVEVPMNVIGVADYLAEFAIRFYDTNAAGTFYLKDMNFVA